MEQVSFSWPESRHLHGRYFFRCLIFCIWISFLNFHYTHAINCYVCHSLNGSNPHCEHPNKIPVNKTAAPVSHNCRTGIGANNPDVDVNAVSCVTSVGQYKNKTVGKIVMAIFRYCTAGAPAAGADPKLPETDCGESETKQLLKGPNYKINGCRKICSTDACNSASIYELVPPMRTEYKNQIERNYPDSKTSSKWKFPDVFAVVEAQKLNEAAGSAHTTGTTSPGSQRTQTAGYLVAAWTLLRVVSLYLK